jgi:hypothetical protein
MGWRDRAKKNFGDFEDIEKGIKNLKTTEKERKEGFKTTFIPPPHNPQNPQNRKNEGEGFEYLRPDQAKITGMVESKKTSPATVPAASPVGLCAEYDRLWNEAWRLAEGIDNPEGAPIEERRASLPKLDRMRERMVEIERQAVPPAGPGTELTPPDTWHTWESNITTRDRDPESCPARCRRSGKCYARAYFKGRPGKAMGCNPDNCKLVAGQPGCHKGKDV